MSIGLMIYLTGMSIGVAGLAGLYCFIGWRDRRLMHMARTHLTDLQSDIQKIARKL